MNFKCKNPYFDENINRKFVFLLYSVLISKGINLGDKCAGLWIDNNKFGILETNLDYETATCKDVSVYVAFKDCIPDGMRYNKELPPRKFKVGDKVKLRAKLDSECSCSYTFSYMGFEENKEYIVEHFRSPAILGVNNWSVHEFEIELVERN